MLITRKIILTALAATLNQAAAFAENMACGANTSRPDHDPGMHQQIAQTKNGPIGYYRFGHGKPLVLITGYRATLSEWNSYFLGALASEHEVIVFDNRGIGESKGDVTDYRIADAAGDTANLIRALGL